MDMCVYSNLWTIWENDKWISCLVTNGIFWEALSLKAFTSIAWITSINIWFVDEDTDDDSEQTASSTATNPSFLKLLAILFL